MWRLLVYKVILDNHGYDAKQEEKKLLVKSMSVFYRDSYWPNGILAETPPRRDKNIRMRTRVAAKTNLLGIMPGKYTPTQ